MTTSIRNLTKTPQGSTSTYQSLGGGIGSMMQIQEQQQIQKQRMISSGSMSQNTYSAIIGIGIFAIVAVPVVSYGLTFMWNFGGFIVHLIVIGIGILLSGLFLVCCVGLVYLGMNFILDLLAKRRDGWIRDKGGVVIREYRDGSFDNLTAQVAAAVTPGIPKDEPGDIVFEKSLQDTIIDLHIDGVGRPTILQSLQDGYPYLTDYLIKKTIREYEDRIKKERERMIQG